MPRGFPNPKPAPPPASEPAPMILIEPVDAGAIRFNAYGLDANQLVDVLRRSLLHVIATQSGVEVISLDVPPHAAVVARPARKPAKPSTNGRPALRAELVETAG